MGTERITIAQAMTQTALAMSDAAAHRDALHAILALAVAVPTIVPGDSIQVIVAKVETALQAFLSTGNSGAIITLNMIKDKALLAWNEVLKPEGITGDRLWAALAVVASNQ